jgi:hypothetical protein
MNHIPPSWMRLWLAIAALGGLFAATNTVSAQAPQITNPVDLDVFHRNEVFVPDTIKIRPRCSERTLVQTGDNVLIGGFSLQGTLAAMGTPSALTTTRVIIRAIGSELTQYGVPNALVDPTLELHDGTGALIASNDNWMKTIIGGVITANQVAIIAASGYAPKDPKESAIIADLPAGKYTAIVRGANFANGVALMDVSDLSSATPSPSPTATPTPSSILGNISGRSFVQTGNNVMIVGFTVEGTQPEKVIVRAIGPELAHYGVPNSLADPTLELHDGTGALIASNDNWMTTIIGGIITNNQVRDIMKSRYAPTDGRESAIIANLPAGNYTAIVRGANDITGVALVDVYDLH